MKTPFAILLALLTSTAHAIDCIPAGLLPALGEGSAWRALETPKVKGRAWWCKLPVRAGDPSGQTTWAMNWYAWHNDDVDIQKFAAAAARVSTAVLTAPDPLKLVNDELLAARTPLVPGSQKEYEYKNFRHKACLLLRDRANWPAALGFPDNPPFTAPSACQQAGTCTLVNAAWPAGVTFRDDVARPSIYEAAHCGAAPVPPVSTAEVWKATGGTIFTFSGGRLTGTTSRRATAGAACDPVPPRAIVGSTNYLQLVGGAATERTACVKQ